MKTPFKQALFWFLCGIAATAFLLIFIIPVALFTDRVITFKTFWLPYLIFGAPFAVSSLCTIIFPEWYLANKMHAVVMGFVSIWGAPIIKITISNIEIGWCFIVSTCAAFFVTHYLRLRKKAQGAKGETEE